MWLLIMHLMMFISIAGVKTTSLVLQYTVEQ